MQSLIEDARCQTMAAAFEALFAADVPDTAEETRVVEDESVPWEDACALHAKFWRDQVRLYEYVIARAEEEKATAASLLADCEAGRMMA